MISSLGDRMRGLKSFPRGIHPPHRKQYSESLPIETFVPKQDLMIPMVQHIGTPCNPIVKAREAVKFGQKIGDVDAPVSAPIHATINGKIGVGTVCLLPAGRRVPALPLKPPAEGEVLPADVLKAFLERDWDVVEPTGYEPDAIVQAVREAGVVGQGGATFPTHFKLRRNPKTPIDTVLLNGCECEPYLTADHRLMVEAPEAIVVGLQLATHAVGARRAIITIEANKPDAIDVMRKASAGRPGIDVQICATKYPMGGERQLIAAVLGRAVPAAPQGLPLHVGVVVVNVATAHSIAHAVVKGKPFTHRVVSVTGGGITRPGNWLVPVGTSFAELIERCGGVTDRAIKVLAGGPMMGPTVPNLNVPVTKGVGGITVMQDEETAHWHESPCMRCGRCITNCPLYLTPTKIAHAVKHRDYDMAVEYDMNACCECGCCSYVCPAQIPLAQYIRAGKNQFRIMAAQKRAAETAKEKTAKEKAEKAAG